MNFNVITTVAGTGQVCPYFRYCEEGIPATAARVVSPYAVAVAPDGALYIIQNQERLRRVSPDGIITTIAGSDSNSDGEGVPATSVRLFGATRVVVGADGSLYLLERGNGRVRRIAPDGIITTFAGIPTGGSTSDDILAVHAQLNGPVDIRLYRI